MSKQSSRNQPEETQLVQTLHRIVDFGIGGVLFVAPLAMAGRYEPGRLLLALVIGITGIAWFSSRVLSRRSHPRWFWTGAEWISLFAILLVALQLMPWSPGMLRWINPDINELLPLHVASAPIDEGTAEIAQSIQFAEPTQQASAAAPQNEPNGATFTWDQATLTPHLTRGGLATLLVFVLFFFVVLQRVRRRADVERMMKGMALAGVSMASLGIVQYVINNGRFLWFMSHPSRDTLTSVKATFANENHFAHFLALTLGPLLWWLVKVQQESKDNVEAQPKFGSTSSHSSIPQLQVLLSIGAGIVFVAGLLTYSKGGLVMLTLSAMITIALLVFQRRVGKKAVIAVCTAGVVAALAVFIHGQDILVRELESLQDVSLESWDADQGRRKIWTAVLTAAPNFATLGSGVGSHRYIYPTFFSSDSSVQYTHAESGYLNVLLETGGPGLGLLLVGIGLTVYWAWKAFDSEDEEIQFLAVPLVASIAVSLIHAVFDFNWYIPANLCLTLIIVALSARLWDLSAGGGLHRVRINKVTWAGLAVVAVMMSVYSVSHYAGPARGLPAWHEFRAWSLATRGGGNGRRGELQNLDAMDPETIGHMIEILDEVLKHDPGHGRAHVRMASMCMRQFELLQAKSDSRMPLAEIRDAAKTSEFESHQAMSDWVDRVVQDNRVYLDRILWHSKQGARFTPTEGNAYLYLAEVAFLDESIQATEHELLRQAYAVRPYEPAIQFSLGRHELLAGNQPRAMELWKDAFNRGDSVRQRIIAAVGFQAPPQEILDLFQPDLEGLRDLFQYYRGRDFVPQMNFIAQRFVVELEKQAKLMTGKTAGNLWREAQFVHATLGNQESAANAAKNSVMVDPTNFENHYACGLRMRDCERFEDAAKEFRWCASRKPEDPTLRKIVADMKNQARQLAATNAATIEQSRFQRQNARPLKR